MYLTLKLGSHAKQQHSLSKERAPSPFIIQHTQLHSTSLYTSATIITSTSPSPSTPSTLHTTFPQSIPPQYISPISNTCTSPISHSLTFHLISIYSLQTSSYHTSLSPLFQHLSLTNPQYFTIDTLPLPTYHPPFPSLLQYRYLHSSLNICHSAPPSLPPKSSLTHSSHPYTLLPPP